MFVRSNDVIAVGLALMCFGCVGDKPGIADEPEIRDKPTGVGGPEEDDRPEQPGHPIARPDDIAPVGRRGS